MVDALSAQRALRQRELELEALGNACDPRTVRKRGYALWAIADHLRDLNRFNEAASRYEQAETIFRCFVADQETPRFVALARANTLFVLERWDEAAAVFDRLIAETGIAGSLPGAAGADAALGDSVAGAVILWLLALEQVDDIPRMKEAAESVSAALDHSWATAKQRAAVVEALRLIGVVAQASGDFESALMAYQNVIECDSSNELTVLARARAAVSRATVLGELGRWDEALAACEEVVAKFGSKTDSSTRLAVEEARSLKRALPH